MTISAGTSAPTDSNGTAGQPAPNPVPARPQVEVRTSTRRRKYASGFWQGDHIVVVLPARLPRAEREAMVETLVQRVLRHRPHVAAPDEALGARAAALADRYLDGVRARSVRWSAQQRRRWGSCTLETRDIRISELLRPTPPWVVDAVLVHELAHLLEHGHGPQFRELVSRYERMADADVFLSGYALGLDHDAAKATAWPPLGDLTGDTDGPAAVVAPDGGGRTDDREGLGAFGGTGGVPSPAGPRPVPVPGGGAASPRMPDPTPVIGVPVPLF